MALNFPASPSVNDTYVSGGITYTWDGTSWKASSSFNETDPVFTASPAFGIDSVDISNWNTAYGWGDHSTQGYLTSIPSPPAAGAEGNIQYNSNGNLGAVSNLTWLSASNRLSVSGNISVNDGDKIYLGNDVDFYLEHSTVGGFNNSNIVATGNSLTVQSYKFVIDNVGGSNMIECNGGAAVNLYYDGNKKLETTNTGATVTGDLNFTGDLYQNGVLFSGGGSSLQSRTTAQVTTASISNGSSTYVTVVAAKTYVLQKIQTSAAAWVTLYTDTTSRTNDATRSETTDPLPGSGVVAEVITTEASTQKITPGTIGWNDDDIAPSSNVYLKVVNKSGSTQAITVTLHYVQLEN